MIDTPQDSLDQIDSPQELPPLSNTEQKALDEFLGQIESRFYTFQAGESGRNNKRLWEEAFRTSLDNAKASLKEQFNITKFNTWIKPGDIDFLIEKAVLRVVYTTLIAEADRISPMTIRPDQVRDMPGVVTKSIERTELVKSLDGEIAKYRQDEIGESVIYRELQDIYLAQQKGEDVTQRLRIYMKNIRDWSGENLPDDFAQLMLDLVVTPANTNGNSRRGIYSFNLNYGLNKGEEVLAELRRDPETMNDYHDVTQEQMEALRLMFRRVWVGVKASLEDSTKVPESLQDYIGRFEAKEIKAVGYAYDLVGSKEGYDYH